MKAWYEELFENYGQTYDREVFTFGTKGECDFIEHELGYDASKTILDIGCGTGRHAIELTKRGYSVMGIDLSANQLKRARDKAAEAGLDICFEQHDARTLSLERDFDAVIMLCEGGFPLMETDAMNYAILSRAGEALKAGGKLIFTTLNGLYPLFHSVQDFLEGDKESSEDGTARYDDFSFDLMTFREESTIEIVNDLGVKKRIRTSERYYIPPEIRWLLQLLGFTQITISGARLGAFSREHPLTPDDFEMLVVAEKAEA